MSHIPHRHDRDARQNRIGNADEWFHSGDLDDLSARIPAPDLTNEIMGRLGFERAEQGAARRQRARRHLVRAATVLAAALALAAGMHYYTLSQRARRAGLPTIPNAVSTSIEESSRAVSDFSRAIREMLAPRLDRPADDGFIAPSPLDPRDRDRLDSPIDPAEVSRVRWSGLL